MATRPRRHVRLRLPPNAKEIVHPISKETVPIARPSDKASVAISATTPNLLDLKTVIWDVDADLEASMAGMFSIDTSAGYTYFLSEFALAQPMLQLDPAKSVEAVYGNAATLLFKSTAVSGTVTSLTGATAHATVDTSQVSAQYVGQNMGSSDTELSDAFSTAGDLTVDALEELGNGMASAVVAQLASEVPPGPLYGDFVTPSTTLLYRQMASAAYALGQIYEQEDYDTAISNLAAWRASYIGYDYPYQEIDPFLVQLVYWAFDLMDSTTEPSSDDSSTAYDLLWSGKNSGDKSPPSAFPSTSANQTSVVTVDVPPYVTAGSAAGSTLVAALAGLGGGDDFAISAGPDPSTNPSTKGLVSESLTVDTVLDIGFADMVQVSNTNEVQFYETGYRLRWDVAGVDSSAIKTEYWQVGYRVLISYWGTDIDTTLSLSSIAARTTLQTANSNFALQVYGLDVSQLGGFEPAISAFTGPFDASALVAIGTLGGTLAGALELSNSANFIPVLGKVDIDPQHEVFTAYMSSACSLVYAMSCIYYEQTLTDAVNNAKGTAVDTSVIAGVYANFTKDGTPSSSDSSFANYVLTSGT